MEHEVWGMGEAEGIFFYLNLRSIANFTVCRRVLAIKTYLGPEPIYHVICLNILKCLSTMKHTLETDSSALFQPDVL